MLETAFAKLKGELCDSVALQLPNPHKPFVVQTDASIHAVGAVLLQSEGEQEYPMPFYSQALTAAQCNYSPYELELLAVEKAWDDFRVYLLGREFSHRKEHAALSACFNSPQLNQSCC